MLTPFFPGVKVGTFTRVIVAFTQFSEVKVAHTNKVRISHRELACLQPMDWAHGVHDFRGGGGGGGGAPGAPGVPPGPGGGWCLLWGGGEGKKTTKVTHF